MHDLKAKLTCPNCNRSITIKVREMVPGRAKACPHGCGATLNFTGDDGRKVQHALDDLERTIRRLGGR